MPGKLETQSFTNRDYEGLLHALFLLFKAYYTIFCLKDSHTKLTGEHNSSLMLSKTVS